MSDTPAETLTAETMTAETMTAETMTAETMTAETMTTETMTTETMTTETMTTVTNVADDEEAMRDVVEPELGINVVDLGLVYGITVDSQSQAVLDMTLTSAACPLTDVIEDQTQQALEGLVTSFRINWVWMPPWGPDKITDDGREQLRALGFNL